MHKDLEVNIDASEHISNILHRAAQLMRKSRYSRNNNQSNLSDYTSSTSSSMRVPNQITNPSCECITCIQPHKLSQIHSVEKSQKFNKRASVYCELAETSSAQTKYQKVV